MSPSACQGVVTRAASDARIRGWALKLPVCDSMKALLRLYKDCIEALLRLYELSSRTKALWRLYEGSMKALLRLYKGSMKTLWRLYCPYANRVWGLTLAALATTPWQAEGLMPSIILNTPFLPSFFIHRQFPFAPSRGIIPAIFPFCFCCCTFNIFTRSTYLLACVYPCCCVLS
jgi:hypothetical protein